MKSLTLVQKNPKVFSETVRVKVSDNAVIIKDEDGVVHRFTKDSVLYAKAGGIGVGVAVVQEGEYIAKFDGSADISTRGRRGRKPAAEAEAAPKRRGRPPAAAKEEKPTRRRRARAEKAERKPRATRKPRAARGAAKAATRRAVKSAPAKKTAQKGRKTARRIDDWD